MEHDEALEFFRKGGQVERPETLAITFPPESDDQHAARLATYGIPPEFRMARRSHFDPFTVAADSWLWEEPLGEPMSVLIGGENGAGKSYLAAALCGEWRGRWVSVRDLVLRVRATYVKEPDETELGIMHDMVKPKVLVLDDLTAAKTTEHGMALMLGYISARTENLLATVVTCHHGLASINDMDSALASRLAGFAQVKLRGKDRRLSR